MTENEIVAAVQAREMSPADAADTAELYGYKSLHARLVASMAEQAEATKKNRNAPKERDTVFTELAKARWSANDAARAMGLPVSTVAAACSGRIAGRLNSTEKLLLISFLEDRIDAAEAVLDKLVKVPMLPQRRGSSR